MTSVGGDRDCGRARTRISRLESCQAPTCRIVDPRFTQLALTRVCRSSGYRHRQRQPPVLQERGFGDTGAGIRWLEQHGCRSAQPHAHSDGRVTGYRYLTLLVNRIRMLERQRVDAVSYRQHEWGRAAWMAVKQHRRPVRMAGDLEPGLV